MNAPEDPKGRPAPTPVALSTTPDLSREAVPGQKVALAPGQLQMRPSRRGKPPVHLADLSLTERVAAVEEMGLPGFRAKQLSVHYFEHFTTAAEDLTDLPRDRRDELVERFFPPLLTQVSRQSARCAGGLPRRVGRSWS